MKRNILLTMAEMDSSREKHFPAIEKKYGEKMAYWFKVMKEIKDEKYPQQIAHLRENYGFSQAHANALVMYSRGSTSTKRHETPAAYYKTIDPQQAKTIRAIFKLITTKYPKLEHVIAWNQPMVRIGTAYIFGMSASKNHISFNPFSKDVLDQFIDEMEDLRVSKHTVAVPNNWKVNEKLILKLVKARLAEIK
jgi:uncharacterized protein YdhG (YjbR/CyaY superfamily)